MKSSSVFVSRAGATLATNYYYPYGGRRGGTFSPLSTKRFTGQYHEADLTSDEGLSYYGARWYDAKLGRFLSADTIVPAPANPQAFNRYSYVINNPLRFVDPTGHSLAEFDPGPGGPGRPYQLVTSQTRSVFGTRTRTYKFYTDRTFSWHNISTLFRSAFESSIFGAMDADVKSGLGAWQAWGERNHQRMPAPMQAVSEILEDPFIGMAITASLPNPSSLAGKIRSARVAQARLGNMGVGNPTVATVEDGSIMTHSGWGVRQGYMQGTDDAFNLADDLGHTFQTHEFDRGVAGRYYASHAESQMAALAPNQAVATSNIMCTQCKILFSKIAVHRGEVQVVADPYRVHIFYPDGTIKSIPK